MRDPRLGLVTITGLDLTKDSKYAKVYWSISKINQENNSTAQADAQKALDGASGRIKKEIGKYVQIRCIPTLSFIYDESGDTGSRIDELLNKVGL